MQIVEYESFSKNSHHRSMRDASAMTDRKRFKFYHCIMQTFDMLRLHPDARVKDFLGQPVVRQSIVAEARRWINDPMYAGALLFRQTPWCSQFNALNMNDKNPFHNAWHKDRIWYLFENISRGKGIMGDISDTLDSIMKRGALYSPAYIEETTAQFFMRAGVKDRAARMRWLKTVSAPAIASNAFDLGWELRMLSIVRDFDAEVARLKPKCYFMMRAFLRSVEANILKLQQKEEDTNVAAAIALQRAGLAAEVCRMIMPCKTRYMGIPLAMMPPYLKLV